MIEFIKKDKNIDYDGDENEKYKINNDKVENDEDYYGKHCTNRNYNNMRRRNGKSQKNKWIKKKEKKKKI